jgi:biopolymer transport protein ExbD
MAELNTGDGGGKKGGKVRSKKANSKVDLTAMVDLAFLLITFFMLTTTLSKPQSMDLALPDPDPEQTTPPMKVDEKKTVTILIDDNNRLVYYMGRLESPIEGPKDITYGRDGIRKILVKKKKEVFNLAREQDKMIVIIKPSKKSNYRNLVDILDEIAIVDIKIYAIVNDFTPEEQKLLEN